MAWRQGRKQRGGPSLDFELSPSDRVGAPNDDSRESPAKKPVNASMPILPSDE